MAKSFFTVFQNHKNFENFPREKFQKFLIKFLIARATQNHFCSRVFPIAPVTLKIYT